MEIANTEAVPVDPLYGLLIPLIPLGLCCRGGETHSIWGKGRRKTATATVRQSRIPERRPAIGASLLSLTKVYELRTKARKLVG